MPGIYVDAENPIMRLVKVDSKHMTCCVEGRFITSVGNRRLLGS
jgi:hypothetical protein